jgi:hypothetical protein
MIPLDAPDFVAEVIGETIEAVARGPPAGAEGGLLVPGS